MSPVSRGLLTFLKKAQHDTLSGISFYLPCLFVCLFFDSVVLTVGIRYIDCASSSIVESNIPWTAPQGISPPFCCCTADLDIATAAGEAEKKKKKPRSGGKPRKQVWGGVGGCGGWRGVSPGLSNSGPGQGRRARFFLFIYFFNKHTPLPNLPCVLSRPWFSKISGGDGAAGFGEVGPFKAKGRARTLPSLQFGLVGARSQLASLGLDGKRAGMRHAHACTYQQM